MASSSVIVGSQRMPFNILCDAQNSGGSDKHAVETKCGCRGSVVGSPAAPLELCCHAQGIHIISV